MAPVLAEKALSLLKRELLEKRQNNNNCYRTYYGGVRCYNSGWYNWGRWVLLGLIVFFFILTLFCLSFTSRRRRARGARPMYGTGWMSQGPLAPPPYQAQPSAPPYSAYDQGNAYAPQQPKPTYNGGQQGYEMNNNNNYNDGSYGHSQYAPPAGPPPNQYNGVVR